MVNQHGSKVQPFVESTQLVRQFIGKRSPDELWGLHTYISSEEISICLDYKKVVLGILFGRDSFMQSHHVNQASANHWHGMLHMRFLVAFCLHLRYV